MVNTNKLKGILAENSFKQSEIAKIIGISLNSFNKKLNNKSQFTLSEVYILIKVLGISEFRRYFFKDKIPNMQQRAI